MNRTTLIELLERYDTTSAEERMFIPKFLQLLDHPDAFLRSHLPGHITGSAWIVDPSREYVLLTHHAKLNRWLQPGGHADGDEDVANVSRKEANEETGLKELKLISDGIFDIDIHTIPQCKDFPEHLHYDVRFVFEVSKQLPLILSEESHALAWLHVDDIDRLTDHNVSMLRMARKVKSL